MRLISIDLVRAAKRSEELKNLPEEELRENARAYERFLELAGRHRGALAPTRAIDQMWHLHMLHPVAYHRDCMRLFGRILDHDGGFGSVPEEEPLLKQVFEKTARLWEEAFGEPYGQSRSDGAEKCWHNCKNTCWHACSKVEDVVMFMAPVGDA